MTESNAGPSREDAINELTKARALEAHIRPQDSSDISLHLQELLDHLVNAGFALAEAVGALESKVYESENTVQGCRTGDGSRA